MVTLPVTISDALYERLEACAARDAADVKQCVVRYLAWGIAEDEARAARIAGPATTPADVHPPRSPLPYYPEEPAPYVLPRLAPEDAAPLRPEATVPGQGDPFEAAQSHLRRRRTEAGLDPATGLPLPDPSAIRATDHDPGPPPEVKP